MSFAKLLPTRNFITMISLVLMHSIASGQSISRIGDSPYPATMAPDTLFMVQIDALPSSQQLTLVTLQGLLARVKPQIMVTRGAQGYINDLPAQYGVTYDSTYFTDFKGLLTHFIPRIAGYILCNVDDTTTNAAISVCSMLGGIAVNPADTALMDSLGISQICSAIGKGEVWAFDSFPNAYSKKIITMQDPAKCTYVSDYSIFAGGFQLFDFPNLPRTLSIFSTMQVNGAVFGWFSGENTYVTTTSQFGLHVHASDFSNNLSVYSNISIPQQHQITHAVDTVLRPGVHTVCFVMTDGDNLQWYGGDFLSNTNWYASPHRGEYNLGWTISPALAELAPTQMKHVYDSASTRPNAMDGFIAAPSGLGYSYPDIFSVPDSGAAITSRMMQKSDLSILNVIANSYSVSELAPYMAEPNIEAIFYYPYTQNYWALHGFTDCINGKPVISPRFNLVQPDFSTYTLAQAIDTMPKNPYSDEGYSLIAVNVWSSSVDSVIQCMQMLDSTIRIVTPESFVRLYMAGNNCIPDTTGINALSPAAGVTVSAAPDPSTDRVQIVYTLPQGSTMDAVLRDQSGRFVKELFSGFSEVGTHSLIVDTHSLSSGMYYYTLHGDYFDITRKLIVIR